MSVPEFNLQTADFDAFYTHVYKNDGLETADLTTVVEVLTKFLQLHDEKMISTEEGNKLENKFIDLIKGAQIPEDSDRVRDVFTTFVSLPKGNAESRYISWLETGLVNNGSQAWQDIIKMIQERRTKEISG